MQQDVLWGTADGLLRSWRVQPGAKVKQGDVLATVEPASFQLIAPVSGTLVSCLVRNNTKVSARQLVCTISTCTHSILTISDTCATCHVQLHDTSEYAFYVTPSNHPIKRRVADVEAESEAKKQALLQSKRLVLVLDLDQTVLHAAILQSYDRDLSQVELDPPQQNVYAFELSDRSRMVVKFRPGLREFLLDVHERFEIHVYTMANAEYASKIVDLINSKILADVDPLLRQQVIGQRIITRSHTEDRYEQQLRRQGGMAYVMKLREKRKDIKHIVGDSSIAVILDDSDGVWPDYLDHLIHVHPYVYWPNQADLNKVFHGRSKDTPAPKPIAVSSSLSSPTSTASSSTIASTSSSSSSSPSPDSTESPESDPTTTDPMSHPSDNSASSTPIRKRPLSEMSVDTTPDDTEDMDHEGNGAPGELEAYGISPSSSGSECSPPRPKRPKSTEMEGSEEDHRLSNDQQTEQAEQIEQTKAERTLEALTANVVTSYGASHLESQQLQHQLGQPYVSSSTLLLPFGIRFLPSANDDTILASMYNVLCDLHRHFFELDENSKRRKVQTILPKLRRQVLQSRRICLTGFIPRMPKPEGAKENPFALEQAKNTTKEKDRLEAFGAQFVEDISIGNPEGVTHVVSARGTTVKARTASQCDGVYCVTRPWLEQTINHWSVQSEAQFAMPDIPYCKGTPPSFPCQPLWTIQDQENDVEPVAIPISSHSHESVTSPSSDGFVDLDSLLQNDYSVASDDYASD